ncbi:autotransporter outer membrane beta-barrel domain-containing protein [Bartonella alsatica]|uniref:Outer membrane autotransporter barrel domain-containing protein n=2 Tax=Bartonella alsatica TaxID=52764 RepID=J0PSX5_9HYPH|nr:outer membrane autotransporter barrel domain-containing protein [Bartonella alsatica IBS 382]QLC52554.1 autotransporter outer membrane beta-barrel domain-containing protein [Bartonella alsatica]
MHKKYLSLYKVATVMMLSSIPFNAHAFPTLSAKNGENITGTANATYDKILVIGSGTIHGKDLKVEGPLTRWTETIREENGQETIIEHTRLRGIGVEASAPESQIYLENVDIQRVTIGLDLTNYSIIKITKGTINAGQNSDREIAGIKINNHSIAELNDITVDVINGPGAQITNGSVLNIAGGSITSFKSGISFVSSAEKNKLQNVTINTKENGIMTDASTVTLKNVTVENAQKGIYADNNSQIIVSAGSFQGKDLKIGLYAGNGSSIILEDGVTILSTQNAIQAEKAKSKITMTGGVLTTTGTQAAAYAKSSGQINLTNVVVNAKGNGLLADDQEAKIKMTGGTLTTTGIEAAAYAKSSGQINLINVVVNAEGNGLKVQGNQSKIILKDSKVFSDLLLVSAVDTKSPGISFVTAENSVLEGSAKILANDSDKINQTSLSLINGTTWLLKISTQEKDNAGNLLDITKRSHSEVSVLNLDNSSIIFDSPTEAHYQTLHIGAGKPDTAAVYNATRNAKIYFNTEWNNGTTIKNQKTDRLLIHGDVLGTTTVYFQNRLEKEIVQAENSGPLNTLGISLIQVSGKANKNSFKLKNGYIAIKGLPYKYTLTAYGSEADYGQANANQNLLGSGNNFWDFRLQNAFLDPNLRVKAVLPQVPSYFVMPNALFYTGLIDIVKQNTLLANMRTSIFRKEKKNSFFLYTYGSTGTLFSERAPRKYGYSGANFGYTALQGGATLAELEEHNITTHFGLVGTYGQLSFTPKDMKDAGKSILDKWSLTAYNSMQHKNGFYFDTLLSYEILKGDITNAIIGKTAKLKNAKMLSISTTVGKQFVTIIQGVTFEPQAQIAYQHLMFDTLADADGFKVDMNNPHQWMIRVGGRATKTFSITENSRSISFYGKVNMIKTMGDNEAIYIDKDYPLDPMGSFLEGGVGISAKLSQNVSLHGDISYQQKLQKTGITGTNFSGGIRYQF